MVCSIAGRYLIANFIAKALVDCDHAKGIIGRTVLMLDCDSRGRYLRVRSRVDGVRVNLLIESPLLGNGLVHYTNKMCIPCFKNMNIVCLIRKQFLYGDLTSPDKCAIIPPSDKDDNRIKTGVLTAVG